MIHDLCVYGNVDCVRLGERGEEYDFNVPLSLDQVRSLFVVICVFQCFNVPLSLDQVYSIQSN